MASSTSASPERPAPVDVLVVGTGPGGSAAAVLLARAGFSVTAVDRAAFPRDKACSEYMSPEAVRLLDRLGVVAAARGGRRAHRSTGTAGHRRAREPAARPISPSAARALPADRALARAAPARRYPRRRRARCGRHGAGANGRRGRCCTTAERSAARSSATPTGSAPAIRARLTDRRRRPPLGSSPGGSARAGTASSAASRSWPTSTASPGSATRPRCTSAREGYVGLNPIGGGRHQRGAGRAGRSARGAGARPRARLSSSRRWTRFPGVRGRVARRRGGPRGARHRTVRRRGPAG